MDGNPRILTPVRRTLVRLAAAILLCSCGVSCRTEEVPAPPQLGVKEVETVAVLRDDSSPAEWPQNIWFDPQDHRIRAAEYRNAFSLSQGERGFVLQKDADPLVLGYSIKRSLLNELVAATDIAHGPDGESALLVGTEVLWLEPGESEVERFETGLPSRPGALTISDDQVYVLVQGKSLGPPSVVGFDRSGSEVGRWGKMPWGGVIQTVLSGGGITTCPDGSVHFSHVNSPEIGRLESGEITSFGPMGEFETLGGRRVERAREKSLEKRSPVPLVKVGRSGSRVMAIKCSSQGLLFRQLAHPDSSPEIEVWHSEGTPLGMIKGDYGILLGVSGNELILADVNSDKQTVVTHVRFMPSLI